MLKALKKAMAVLAKNRTQTMAEPEKGLFAEPPKPKPVKPIKPPKPKSEPKPKKDSKPVGWLIPVATVLVLICGMYAWKTVIKPANDYTAAQARETILSIAYQNAQSMMVKGRYMRANHAFSVLDYRDSREKAQEAKAAYWQSKRKVSIFAGSSHTLGTESRVSHA